MAREWLRPVEGKADRGSCLSPASSREPGPQASNSPNTGSYSRKDTQGKVSLAGKRTHPHLFSFIQATPYHSWDSPQQWAHKF